MKLETLPENITINAIVSEVGEYCILTKTVPDHIDMTIEQYKKLDYITAHCNNTLNTHFKGIPILIQGKPVK